MVDEEMKYFDMDDDTYYENRWYLGDVGKVDNWQLADGSEASDIHEVLEVEIYQDGREMDFTLTEGYGVPIVSRRFREALPDLKTARYLPVRVLGRPPGTDFFVLVIESVVECVDEDRSEFQKFTIDDPVRPDKAGQYRGFFTLVLNKKMAQASGSSIFRVAKFEQAIIVDSEVYRLLISAKINGIRMQEV